MKNRILGFFEGSDKVSLPIAFFHKDARGRSCVNGRPHRVRLAPPGYGEPLVRDVFTVRLSGNLFPMSGHGFLHMPGDDVLLECANPEKNETLCEVLRPGFATVSEPVEFWPPINAGVLTVSDQGSEGKREDTSGPALAEALAGIGGVPLERNIVPDDTAEIVSALKEWVTREHPLDLVLTTGGTGLAERDVTPEALDALTGKDVPGLGEYMRWKTSSFTLRSILSRSTAKVVERTLVVALPGSKRGALQCFEAVSPVLRHAVEIASGKGGECGGHHA